MKTITIQETDNGYIVTNRYTVEEDKEVVGEFLVIEENKDDDKDTISRLLYKVAECLGNQYNKWGEDNLSISWEKEHKLE